MACFENFGQSFFLSTFWLEFSSLLRSLWVRIYWETVPVKLLLSHVIWPATETYTCLILWNMSQTYKGYAIVWLKGFPPLKSIKNVCQTFMIRILKWGIFRKPRNVQVQIPYDECNYVCQNVPINVLYFKKAPPMRHLPIFLVVIARMIISCLTRIETILTIMLML